MSKKFLRPPPTAALDDSDSEEEDELLDDDDEDDAVGSTVRKRPGSQSGGNDRKRSKQASFFELEAEASDDDEDDGDIDNKDEQMDEEAQEIMRQQDRRRAQAGGRFGERSVADISRDIESRHRMQRRTIDRSALYDRTDGDEAAGGPEVYTAVAQQSLVPSVSDPSLWMVSCLNGKEQELILQIMNKCVAMARQNKPLGICGAIAAQTKGKIYIESYSEPAVLEAVQGIRGLMQYTMRLVPIGDMTTVMTVTSKKKPVQKNEWVRMTRGHYKDDLALVKDVKESGLKCIVQCVPRLDLTLADLPPEEARIRRKSVRPPQKFFNPQEIAALGRQSLSRQRFPGMNLYCDYFEGNFYHDGYLLKEVTVGSMIKPCTEETPPTLDELQSFQRRKHRDDDDDVKDVNEGSRMASSLLDELSELQGKTGIRTDSSISAGGLLIGDTIEVIEGELIGLRGKLMSFDGSTVKVKSNNATVDLGGTDEVEFLSSQVRKYIAVGAHVKVMDGRYANETGTVVAIEQLGGQLDFTAVVLTDVTNKEISVRMSQLRESAEVASGQDKLSGYELYDLVVLSGGGSANEVGVVVRVGREDFTVINTHGIVREVRPEELRGKRNSVSTRAVALDAQGGQIRCGDTVNVSEGPHKGKSATVKRMSRAQLFLHSQTRSEHAGVFVVRSRSCILAGSSNQNRTGASDFNAFAASQSSSRGLVGGRGKKDETLVGKTVRVKLGQWKGYLGTVADATATHVQVELHSRLKKVMVVRENVMVVGDKFGATDEHDKPLSSNPIGLAPTTPFVAAGQTPMHGGATPMHERGALDIDNNDDVWRPGGRIDNENLLKEDGWGAVPEDNFKTRDTAGGFGSWGAGQGVWNGVAKAEEEGGKGAPLVKYDISSTVIKRELASGEMESDPDAEVAPVWFMERVCVQIKKSMKKGVIKEVYPNRMALIELEDSTTKETKSVADLAMVPPMEHDMVLVIGGNEVGLEGTLVCVDGNDAILKDANDDFKIVEISFLARVQG